ncbi:MAG: 5-formyltetrahydrofolate cyclo-ligase [Lachnospiraceae bacterium]|nr:5-formyltetrahydrofolate cyclo-ligase [Lachnospiraceae bacterium]
MDESKENKGFIRKQIMVKRGFLSEEEKILASKSFLVYLDKSDILVGKKRVLTYASYSSEFLTDDLFEYVNLKGIKVYYPKVVGRDLEFYLINSLSELSPDGYKGIREPIGTGEKYLYDEVFCNEELIFLPGVAFDKKGNRLGYGGGYYDRFLADKPELVKNSYALGFKMQEVPHIPTKEYDIKPAHVLLF